MSFFGFDTSLPSGDRERSLAQGHNTDAPGFSQQYDAFAGLGGRGLEDEGLDFDDTYDGLGDRLEESGDAFNDDTFGDAPATQENVGRDFDFFGNTANVAQAMREEGIRYDAGRMPAKLSPQKKPSKPVRTGYEGYIPELEAQSNLWGLSKKSPEPTASQSQAPARKMMTLEEIEASMRSQRAHPAMPEPESAPAMPHSQMPPPQNLPQFGTFGAPIPGLEPPADLYFYQQQMQQLQQFHHPQQIPPLGQGPQILQRPPQAPPQQRQPEPQQAELPAQGIQHPHILQRQRPIQPQPQPAPRRPTPPEHIPTTLPQEPTPPTASTQPRQILQNPNRLSGHGLRVQGGPAQQPVEVLQRRSPAGPRHQRGYSGPIITNPQQILQLSAEEKAAVLLEDAKRAKRNHKIAMMAKYNGLMTPGDKNFISRIQLSQLLQATNSNLDNQNPDDKFLDDFYYNVYSQIRSADRQNPNEPANKFAQMYLFQTGSRYGHGRRYHRGGDNSMQRMEQQVQRAVEVAKARNKPRDVSIEGSLGKISFSNAKTPRPLLSIKRTESEQQRPHTPARRPSHYDAAAERRTILRNIETIYASLMKMEDHERRLGSINAAITEDDRVSAHVEWRESLQELHTQLWNDLKLNEPLDPASGVVHPFIALLSHAKGMKLIPRVWRHIDEKERLTAVTMIILHLDSLEVISKAVPTPEMLESDAPSLPPALKEEIELFLGTVSQSLFATVQEGDMRTVLGLLGIVLDNTTVRTLVLTKVGLCILTMLISRLEVLKNGAAIAPSPENMAKFNEYFASLLDATEPVLPYLFVSANGSIRDADDFHVWQFLAAMGASANADQQARLVVGVKERVMEAVRVSRALPADMQEQRLGCVNLFMKAIGLDVTLLD